MVHVKKSKPTVNARREAGVRGGHRLGTHYPAEFNSHVLFLKLDT